MLALRDSFYPVIAAFLVGFILGIINKVFGKYRDKLLGKTKIADDTAETDDKPTYVISISREYGSGGRAIGKILAEKLGYKYYDTELIKLVQRSVQFPFFVGLNRGRLYFHVPIPAMFSDTAFCCMVFSRCDVLFIFRQKHQSTKREYFIVCFI